MLIQHFLSFSEDSISVMTGSFALNAAARAATTLMMHVLLPSQQDYSRMVCVAALVLEGLARLCSLRFSFFALLATRDVARDEGSAAGACCPCHAHPLLGGARMLRLAWVVGGSLRSARARWCEKSGKVH